MDIAFQKALELGEKATGPKKLGVFGASYVRGVLYLDDVPEDDSANDAGDSSVDKPGDADNEEPENGGGNNDADLPPEREEAPSEYENDGNTATIRYGELKTLGAESRYEEIKMLNGMKDNVLSVGFVLLIP